MTEQEQAQAAAEPEEQPVVETSEDLSGKRAALEAVLFMAAEPIPTAELAEILEVTPTEADRIAADLAEAYEGRGLQLTRVAGGYQVCTRPEYGPFVAKLHKPERFRLSRAALETLAIVAYKQPITRPEIEEIRGVNSDSPIDTLCQYQLIREAGRKDSPGRPMLYCTTDSFLGHFGLNSVADLPSIDSIPSDEAAAKAEAEKTLGPAPEGEETSEDPGGEQSTEEPPTSVFETEEEGLPGEAAENQVPPSGAEETEEHVS